MSYVCLMVNAAGAAAAGDSRETFPGRIHLDWRQKCFLLGPEKLIWACCGPTLRYGVDVLRGVRRIFAGKGTMEEKLERIRRRVDRLTRLRLPWDDPGAFHILAARWEQNHFRLWNVKIVNGTMTVEESSLPPDGTAFLHAGAWNRQMPSFDPAGLKTMTYEELRRTACQRVALAIAKDEKRRQENRKHNQTIGGAVRSVGIAVKNGGSAAQNADDRAVGESGLEEKGLR